jgi:hypothetical protein
MSYILGFDKKCTELDPTKNQGYFCDSLEALKIS